MEKLRIADLRLRIRRLAEDRINPKFAIDYPQSTVAFRHGIARTGSKGLFSAGPNDGRHP